MSRPYPAWDAAHDDVFVCTAVQPVADRAVTVVFAPRQPSTVFFEAGQHVTIEFDVDASPVNRCYTIASPPTRPERLSITVGRREGGRVSAWIHDGGLQVGSHVRVAEPQGSFTLAAHPADAYLLLTAGSGITPALSMLREMHDLGCDRDIVLLHSQRRLSEVACYDELGWLSQQLPGLRTSFVCTGHEPSDPSAVRGRMTQGLLTQLTPDLGRREILLCGPEPYRNSLRDAAVAAGCDPRRIHEESFTLDAVKQVHSNPGTIGAASGFTIDFCDWDAEVECPPGSTILEAATAAGLALPFSCTEGLCGTCKSTLRSGEVDMAHAGGIRPREIAAGKILLCCSRPLTNLVIAS